MDIAIGIFLWLNVVLALPMVAVMDGATTAKVAGEPWIARAAVWVIFASIWVCVFETALMGFWLVTGAGPL